MASKSSVAERHSRTAVACCCCGPEIVGRFSTTEGDRPPSCAGNASYVRKRLDPRRIVGLVVVPFDGFMGQSMPDSSRICLRSSRKSGSGSSFGLMSRSLFSTKRTRSACARIRRCATGVQSRSAAISCSSSQDYSRTSSREPGDVAEKVRTS